ncbi:hypothetical protein TYRP_017014 [Tyrophagus putrescentiae]|nr:hypothetical protein TYRP_017014 [Tyrophagus putrescentiae]
MVVEDHRTARSELGHSSLRLSRHASFLVPTRFLSPTDPSVHLFSLIWLVALAAPYRIVSQAPPDAAMQA